MTVNIEDLTRTQIEVLAAMRALIDRGRKVTAVNVSRVRQIHSGNGTTLISLSSFGLGLIDSTPEQGWYFTSKGEEFVRQHLTDKSLYARMYA